ncbi:MAG: hypothetical protein NC930_03845 [Candidatus Omnitrophica bacterium]|nr:hypothetical protein [Candidatus Omnitrophota bacterium]
MPRVLSLKVAVYLLFWLAVDLCFGSLLEIKTAKPIFLYLMVTYAAFQWEASKILPMAVACGILRDLAGTHPFGLETCVLFFASAVLEFLVHKIDREFPIVRLAATFLFLLCVLTMILLVSRILGFYANISWGAFWIALGTAFYTTCLSPIFFLVTSYWFHDKLRLKQYELFK